MSLRQVASAEFRNHRIGCLILLLHHLTKSPFVDKSFSRQTWLKLHVLTLFFALI